MDDRKRKVATPRVLRPDGNHWHLDPPDDSMLASFRSALERARFWDICHSDARRRRRTR